MSINIKKFFMSLLITGISFSVAATVEMDTLSIRSVNIPITTQSSILVDVNIPTKYIDYNVNENSLITVGNISLRTTGMPVQFSVALENKESKKCTFEWIEGRDKTHGLGVGLNKTNGWVVGHNGAPGEPGNNASGWLVTQKPVVNAEISVYVNTEFTTVHSDVYRFTVAAAVYQM